MQNASKFRNFIPLWPFHEDDFAWHFLFLQSSFEGNHQSFEAEYVDDRIPTEKK